jgi:Xaa-Pro aminopeptidase
MLPSRLQNVQNKIQESKLDGFLITFLPHIRYVSNFTGSAGVCLLTNRTNYFISDGRYTQQASEEIKSFKLYTATDGLFSEISNLKLLKHNTYIGIDGNTLILSQLKELRKLFPKVHFIPKANFIDDIASVKDEFEIEQIVKAAAITDNVFEKILEIIKPGLRELDIAAEISYLQRTFGADKDAFEPIVASGTNSALPHARASTKIIRKSEMVTLDFGCVVNGYHSDMTRTIFIGKPKPKAVKIYNIVLEAQQRAITAAKPGISVKELDSVARDFINDAGYGEFFKHSLGHGIGLQIHEQPKISAFNKATLQEGNVVTIEPGIYIPNFGGVRIEDDIVIRNGDADIITKSIKERIVL